MPPGKLCAQTGHAFGDALDYCQKNYPEIASQYRNNGISGSKIALKCKNLNQLIKTYELLITHKFPAVLVVDSEHVMPPHFNGSPIITAIGVGPVRKSEIQFITKKLQCL